MPQTILQLQVGPVAPSASDGVTLNSRAGKSGEQIASELHGRFYEQTYRGNVYSIGCGVTALSANTITLSATSAPILGVWNPSTSAVNLVMLQLGLNVYANTLTTPVGPGAIVLASSVGNTAVSTGSAPFNRKTLASSGSQAKGFPGGVPLTGLTNNVVVFDGVELMTQGPVTYSTTTAMQLGGGGIVNFDGGLIIPPGGVLSVLNTTSTTTMSVVGRLMWEEVLI